MSVAVELERAGMALRRAEQAAHIGGDHELGARLRQLAANVESERTTLPTEAIGPPSTSETARAGIRAARERLDTDAL